MFEKIKQVIKRTKRVEVFDLKKIITRITKLTIEPTILNNVNVMTIIQDISKHIVDRMTTTELDILASDICAQLATDEAQYGELAKRIVVSNNYKNTVSSFDVMMRSIEHMVNDDIIGIMNLNIFTIDEMIDQSRDLLFDFHGFKTLEATYLTRGIDEEIVERPQHVWMRVALEIHRDDMAAVKETYDMLSTHKFTHASPTLFNSCFKKNQLSSCMLLKNRADSVVGIFETIKECAQLGAASAGIGVAVTNIRAKGSLIRSTNRPSKGLISFMLPHNTTCFTIDQGGKRKMSEAIYCEPWHADFMELLQYKSPTNKSGAILDKLFLGVWGNTLLNDRVKAGKSWSFFCPTKAPKLLTSFGAAFNAAYEEYEAAGLANTVLPAIDVYLAITELMIERGQPYNLNKDACNAKSNLKNVSIIDSSNLCAEVLIPSGNIGGEYEIGVCTLASINIPAFVTPAVWNEDGSVAVEGSIDHEGIKHAVEVLVRNLNKIIDHQLYVLPACKRSSMRHRPIGIGIQGLADVFMALGIAFESPEAQLLNWKIAEEMYAAALGESGRLAMLDGSYETFPGSPASQGILQPHLWQQYGSSPLPYNYNWDQMGQQVAQDGLRNSLLLAFMPTASTSHLFGGYAAFDPCSANIIAKKNLVGTFIVTNKWLLAVLKTMKLWNNDLKENIIANNGSIQHLDLPPRVLETFKIAWEMNPVTLMQMSADRGQFICQSQSFNLYIKNPSPKKLMALISHGYDLGLKTISYYIRTRGATDPVKFSISRSAEIKGKQRTRAPKPPCDNEEGCTVCSS